MLTTDGPFAEAREHLGGISIVEATAAEPVPAVAAAEVAGPQAGLALVDDLDLGGYHLFHAIRADLLRRLARDPEAAQAHDAAIEGTANAAERAFLVRRRREIVGD